jgi:hypothetical protein
MAAAFTDATNVLKRLYADDVPLNLATRERWLLSKMTKVNDFAGDDMAIPIQVANPQAAGSNPAVAFDTAFTSGTMANAYKRFLLTQYPCFNGVKLDRQAIMAARQKGKGAFVDLLQDATDGMLDELGAVASRWLYGDGTAQIGVRSGALSGETVTLATSGDAKNFFAGQQLVVYNGTGPSYRTIAAASGYGGIYVTVASVDEENGKFTLTTGDAAAVASFTAGDAFAPAGTTSSFQAWPGLASWLPLTTPSATLFFGVNRSLDPTRLAGVRLDNSTGSIADNIMTVAERCHVIFKGRKRVCVVKNVNFTTLSKDADGKHIYNDGQGTADIGFESIRVMTSAGAVQVYADPDCPANRGYVLDLATWKFHHMGGFPHLVDDGGGQLMQPINASNSVLIKGALYGAPACVAPGSNGVFSI